MKHVILAISTIGLLIGCGGGGGSSTQNSNSNSSSTSQINQNLYSFSYDYDERKDGHESLLERHEIRNNRINYSSEQTGEYILTKSKLFLPNDTSSEIAELKTLTDWTLSEYDDIKTHLKYEAVSLKGVSIYNTVFAGYSNFINYLQQEELDNYIQGNYFDAFRLKTSKINQKFGDNTVCYRLKDVSTPTDQIYFSFNTDESSIRENTFEAQWKIINDLKKLQSQGSTITTQQGTWNGYRWMYIQTKFTDYPELNMEYGFIEFNQKLYMTELHGHENFSTAEINRKLKQKLLKTSDPSELAELKFEIENNEQGCFLFNEAAGNEISIFLR